MADASIAVCSICDNITKEPLYSPCECAGYVAHPTCVLQQSKTNGMMCYTCNSKIIIAVQEVTLGRMIIDLCCSMISIPYLVALDYKNILNYILPIDPLVYGGVIMKCTTVPLLFGLLDSNMNMATPFRKEMIFYLVIAFLIPLFCRCGIDRTAHPYIFPWKTKDILFAVLVVIGGLTVLHTASYMLVKATPCKCLLYFNHACLIDRVNNYTDSETCAIFDAHNSRTVGVFAIKWVHFGITIMTCLFIVFTCAIIVLPFILCAHIIIRINDCKRNCKTPREILQSIPTPREIIYRAVYGHDVIILNKEV